MRARLLIAAAAGMCLLALAACTSPAPDTTGETAQPSPSAIEGDGSSCPGVVQGELCATGAEGERIADLVETAFVDDAFAALIVGVWRDGEPVVIGALGESLPGVAATTEMRHRVGNVSASFLTTVFLQLVDEGMLGLDDPLAEWFPDLPDASRITLADLARSTSGYAHHPADERFAAEFYADPFRSWTPDELIAIGTAEGVTFDPGSAWRFSDTNLVLLGEVIETETDESVHSHIQRRIIEPLGLERTTAPATGAVPEPVLHGFTNERGVWESATNWSPTWVVHAGDLASNVWDVGRWLEVVATGELISETSHDEMLAPVTVDIGALSDDFYYAMGIGVTNGWIFTNPSLHGYRASVGTLPGEGVTVVVFATLSQNADHDGRPDGALFQAIGETLAPEQPPHVVR